MPKRWTVEEEDELLRLSDQEKISLEQLAIRYGVTIKSVSVKLQKIRLALKQHNTKNVLSIPRTRISKGGEAKRWTIEEEQKMYEMYLKGHKTEQIAVYFNVTQKAASVKLLKVKKRFGEQISSKQVQAENPFTASQTNPQTLKKSSGSILQSKVVKPIEKTQPTPSSTQSAVPRPPNPRSKNQEGEVSTQFKVWNGHEWVIIKIPKKITHM